MLVVRVKMKGWDSMKVEMIWAKGVVMSDGWRLRLPWMGLRLELSGYVREVVMGILVVVGRLSWELEAEVLWEETELIVVLE